MHHHNRFCWSWNHLFQVLCMIMLTGASCQFGRGFVAAKVFCFSSRNIGTRMLKCKNVKLYQLSAVFTYLFLIVHV